MYMILIAHIPFIYMKVSTQKYWCTAVYIPVILLFTNDIRKRGSLSDCCQVSIPSVLSCIFPTGILISTTFSGILPLTKKLKRDLTQKEERILEYQSNFGKKCPFFLSVCTL